MKIVSTNIGERKEVISGGKKVVTGIFKYTVDTAVFLDREEVKGDEISDRKYHGGIEQAVYGYSLKHYEYWKPLYPNLEWSFGMFGENLTMDTLDEEKICVGDTFKVGEAILEATLQRDPCHKLGIRFEDMKIVKQVWNTTKCGVYFKVLQTGFVQAGDEFYQIKSGTNNVTIADLLIKKKKEKGI
ncbi:MULTISPECIES: MOSC domain-containing protein [unclassified Polaribacter]|uniref:MOSC domain-containing protein n=1 Tax=unclassified Polaribacter TaxID=196858 RepID=UPI0011BFC62D|nr:MULTISPECIES: MOSC domain-containing protein [unclassified Polaribacter]TXD54074.1 MOSC domain-containing protein [Polaribacter sp. IC063]TXD62590.1 MOSC domain-containing protein [Polaribacter sp. IC066]